MKRIIGFKNRWGKYNVIERTFNDENHYNNWYNKFTSTKVGNRIISNEIITS